MIDGFVELKSTHKRVIMAKAFDSGARRRVALVVLGMHRSGTSVLTRLLSYSGATLPKTIIPAKQDNPKGFWESPFINDFNDKLLNLVNSSWYAVNDIDIDTLCNNNTLLREAGDLLSSEYGNAQTFIIKDPRICRLFPFWLKVFEHLEIDCKVIITIRNPAQVSNSLGLRDGFSEELGTWLWLRHYIDAEFYSRHIRRVFVDFEQLLKDWRSVLLSISKSIELDLFENTLKYSSDVDDFIDHKLPKIEVDESLLLSDPMVKSIVDWTEQAVYGCIESFDVLNKARLNISLLDRVGFSAAQEQVTAITEKNKLLEQQLDNSRVSFKEVEVQLLNSRINIEEKEKELELARQSHAERDSVESELRETLATLECELNDARDSATDMEDQLIQADNGISDLNKQLEVARGSSKEQAEELELARQSQAELECELNDARDSALEMNSRLAQMDVSISKLNEQKISLEERLIFVNLKLKWLSSRRFVRLGLAIFGNKET